MKKRKRIVLLNIWVRLSCNSTIIAKLPDYVEFSKDINGNLYVNYSKILPYNFELEYFTMKNKLCIKHEILYKVSEKRIKILT